jgi:hypothetical protein
VEKALAAAIIYIKKEKLEKVPSKLLVISNSIFREMSTTCDNRTITLAAADDRTTTARTNKGY